MVQEALQLLWFTGADHEIIVHITEPAEGLMGCPVMVICEGSGETGKCGEPIATLSVSRTGCRNRRRRKSKHARRLSRYPHQNVDIGGVRSP
jgi:hypothetical protein